MLPLISEREPAAPLPAPQRPLTQQGVRRTFMPGSESLYAKLYTGNATADRVLTQVLERTPCRALADGWFFGRFDDPYHHLRLRFRGDPAPLSEQLWPALRDACAPLLVDGLLSRVVFDTYERETECYGGPQAIEIAEQIFQADSEATIELVAMLEPGAAGDRERWLFAACGAQMLLRDLGLDAGQRLALLTQLRDSYGREHRADAKLGRAIGERLRDERATLAALLDPETQGDGTGLQAGAHVLLRRSERLAPLVADLDALEARDLLPVSRPKLAASYVHMPYFRLLRMAHRRQELVIYDFLLQHARSQAARARGRPGNPRPVAEKDHIFAVDGRATL